MGVKITDLNKQRLDEVVLKLQKEAFSQSNKESQHGEHSDRWGFISGVEYAINRINAVFKKEYESRVSNLSGIGIYSREKPAYKPKR